MKSNSLPCSVVLAAHGSLADDQANEPLFELAKAIELSGIFSVVTPAFLNGEPNLTSVFARLPEGDVVIVPVMTSDGYYLNQVFPKKLLENDGLSKFRIFITPPMGLHPEIPSLTADRVETLMNLLGMSPAETTVIVVGHGTRRNSDSEKSTQLLVQRLQEILPEHEIRIAFIDQDPSIPSVIADTHRPHLLAIPFLISRGPHTTVDVPEALGLPTGSEIEFPLVDLVGNGLIVCDLPVGMYPEMAELCLELASDQLLTGQPTRIGQSTDESIELDSGSVHGDRGVKGE
jgi:sirohydrochlorin cobaltochelatase